MNASSPGPRLFQPQQPRTPGAQEVFQASLPSFSPRLEQPRSRLVSRLVAMVAALSLALPRPSHAAACPPGNLWPNPNLEISGGSGRPASWNQGGTDLTSLTWDTNTFFSPAHSLLVRDTNINAYGEWYSDPLTLSATCDYSLGFKRRYSTTNGVMRLSANYYDAADQYLAGAHFVVFGRQTNWMDVTAGLIPPKDAAKLRLSLASGGALNVVGTIWVDDLSLTARPTATNSLGHIARIDAMPVMPAPYGLRDWRQVARDYDALAFNFNASGQFLPLIRWDRQQVNFALDGFWQPSYVGATTHGGEAINSLGALLGATLVGIDKSGQNGTNFVLMAVQYFNHANGQDLVLNNFSAVSGGSFWYEIQPHILFSALVDKYPATARLPVPFSSGGGAASMEDIMHSTALKWRDAARVMGGRTNRADFNWTAFNFATMQPIFNGGWREPDSAAGIAWLEYMAYAKFGETQFLQGAAWGSTSRAPPTRSPPHRPQTVSATGKASSWESARSTRARLLPRKPPSNPAPATRTSPGLPWAVKPTWWSTATTYSPLPALFTKPPSSPPAAQPMARKQRKNSQTISLSQGGRPQLESASIASGSYPDLELLEQMLMARTQ